MHFQTPKTHRPDRKDHVWERQVSGDFKCLLCGAVCRGMPPYHPTPPDWLPLRYEMVTEEERGRAAPSR